MTASKQVAVYVRVSSKGQQAAGQRDALKQWLHGHGLHSPDVQWFEDVESGATLQRPGFQALEAAIFAGTVKMVVVWKLDRLGRSLHHLVNTAHELQERGVGFKVLEGEGAVIDTSTTIGKAMFGFFGIMAELERDLNRERTMAGLAAARARGRLGGRRHALSKSQVRQAQAAIGKPETIVAELAAELGISRPALYRYVSPTGELRKQGRAVLRI